MLGGKNGRNPEASEWRKLMNSIMFCRFVYRIMQFLQP